MKHLWSEYMELIYRRRRCERCGAVQSYGCTGGSIWRWRYGWYPRVGRCKGKGAQGERQRSQGV